MHQAGTPVTFTRPDGQAAPAVVFHAASPGSPAIVLIQEWWGINEQICGTAQRLADEGYNVLIPDLYRGKLASSSDEAGHLMGSLDFPDALFQDLAGAVRFAREHHGKVAVMGFCMGGALALAAAVHLTELSAAVCFYGIPPEQLADPSKRSNPLLAHFADHDDWCTPERVQALEAQHLMSSLDFPDALFQDLVGAVTTAREHHGKVGVMGFCMGGALTLAAAVHIPAASAAVCFYGAPPAALADPRNLQVPLQCHFADHDDWITAEVVRNLEEALRDVKTEHEIHRYDAHHAFFNEARPEVHNPEAAALSWRRSLEFLARHLRA
jgi:carboxymethylenebutenolidase